MPDYFYSANCLTAHYLDSYFIFDLDCSNNNNNKNKKFKKQKLVIFIAKVHKD
jgi:hypothetical protein